MRKRSTTSSITEQKHPEGSINEADAQALIVANLIEKIQIRQGDRFESMKPCGILTATESKVNSSAETSFRKTELNTLNRT
jgi:hypothetical protein